MDTELLNKRAQEFTEFCKEIEEQFGSKLTTEHEREIIKDLLNMIKESSGELSLPDQIRFNKRIATRLIDLGTITSKRVKQANIAFRWKKWRKQSEWSPAKKFLEGQSTGKILVGDIEEEVSKRTFAEELIESNIQGLADWLITLHRDLASYRSALQKQIDFNMKSYDYAQHTAQ